MYVPGKFVDTNRVIIDIGTRYYVEKVGILNLRHSQLKSDFSRILKAQEIISNEKQRS